MTTTCSFDQFGLCPSCGEPNPYHGNGKRFTRACGLDSAKPVRRTVNRGGVGTELEKVIMWLGIDEPAGCRCGAYARQLNAMGPEWCEANQDVILDHLQNTSREFNLPFVRFAARGILKLAISRSRP